MVIEVSPLVHIEIVVRDAEKAFEFLNRVFGAEKTEIEFANFLSRSPVAKVVHVQLGNVILQFIEPTGE
ncbi:MAG: VOC family protein, partial [Promethearchaeota archaeon]